MTRINLHIFFFLLFILSSLPLRAAVSPADAVCNVFTYDSEGKMLGSACGFFISVDGNGVAPYEIFQDACRAEVIAADGKRYDVRRIAGASSIYNMVKFTLQDAHVAALPLAAEPARQGANLRIATYMPGKGKRMVATSAKTVSDFNDYKFYDLAAPNANEYVGCPVVDANGKVVAVVQKNLTKNAVTACAMDARPITTLIVNSVGSINFDLQKIGIAKALPPSEKDALAFIYMMNSADSLACITALDDFISQYPDNAEGFVNRATFFATHDLYAQSDSNFSAALAHASSSASTLPADGVYHSFGKTIYETVNKHGGKDLSPTWSYANAIAQEDAAYALNPSPLYQQQKGLIQYAAKDFQGAYASFQAVNASPFASPQSFYSAALCLEQTGGTDEEILALLDSAIAHIERPYTARQAQYLYIRATQEVKMEKYRQAALDLYEYEKAVGPNNLTAQFYYDKEQTERKARMYQQALEDIRTAQAKSTKPDYYFYRLEESSLLLQVGQYDEAIATSEDLLKELPENPDCYKIIGIAYGEKKDKAQALKNLNKAKSLGDTTVDSYIQKFKK